MPMGDVLVEEVEDSRSVPIFASNYMTLVPFFSFCWNHLANGVGSDVFWLVR